MDGRYRLVAAGTISWRTTGLVCRSYADVPFGDYKVVIAIPPTFAGGRFLKFANETQDADVDGWLTVERVRVERR